MLNRQEEILQIINLAKLEKKKVCIFGTGIVSQRKSKEFLDILGLELSCFCDNDENKWGKEIEDGLFCINPIQLKDEKNNFLCIVMVGNKYHEEVTQQLWNLGIKNIITYNELCGLDCIINEFWQFDKLKKADDRKNRIAVYTCIVDNYDEIMEPEYLEDNCDYYLISDFRPNDLKVYKWLNIKEYLPDIDMNNSRKNRYCKINAHKIFPQYKYSLYIDGNVKIIGSIANYINVLGRARIAIHSHPYQDCIFEEALRVITVGYDKELTIRKQLEEYWQEGMPRNYGLYECRILVREHNYPMCVLIMEKWWNEVLYKSFRDQLSLPYILWKNGFYYDDIGIIGGNSCYNEDFCVINNHHEDVTKHNICI